MASRLTQKASERIYELLSEAETVGGGVLTVG